MRPSVSYRTDLRYGCRIFLPEPSPLKPDEIIQNLGMNDLEALAELCGLPVAQMQQAHNYVPHSSRGQPR